MAGGLTTPFFLATTHYPSLHVNAQIFLLQNSWQSKSWSSESMVTWLTGSDYFLPSVDLVRTILSEFPLGSMEGGRFF